LDDYFETSFSEITESFKDTDENMINKLYTLFSLLVHNLSGNLVCMNSIIGGIVAHELIKAASGKYTPIEQFMYIDRLELLIDIECNKNKSIYDKENMGNFLKMIDGILNKIDEYEKSDEIDRYLGQTNLFGTEINDKFSKMTMFIVGSGAIGCEHLKHFAMMGVGNIIITDMDTIEKSNLNRQFLFRNENIGQLKSECAANSIKKMNPTINIIAQSNKVCSDTEHIYNKEFFTGIDVVVNALDNVEARLYVDYKCVTHKKHLIESGTMGTKGNVQIIVPHVTESYGSTRDPPEDSIPICVIKNFPNNISHCVHWGRDIFEGYFKQMPENLKAYLENPNIVKSMSPSDALSFMENIKKITDNMIPKTYSDCVRIAYTIWIENFMIPIMQILKQFPPDHITSEGELFWTKTKKCPKILDFDMDIEFISGFISAASKIWANIFGLDIDQSLDVKEYYETELKNKKISDFCSSIDDILGESVSENDAQLDEKNKEKLSKINQYDVDQVLASLPDVSSINNLVGHIFPQDFEKDDDSNYHIDLIWHAANTRASIYGIENKNRHDIKGIAGKIIPALATTTAVVSGLACIELYKILLGCKNIETYYNSFLNLAVPFVTQTTPYRAPKLSKKKDEKYTIWDSINIKTSMTLEKLIDYIKSTTGLEHVYIMYETSAIYSSIITSKEVYEKRKDMLIEKIIDGIKNIGFKKGDEIILDAGNDDMDDDDIDIDSSLPPIHYVVSE